MKKIGFTLAEIMIVLSVIAILTAILLPSARNAMPNEDVMKFKKGHNALYQAINELVNSDKYYLDGDLGTKTDGALVGIDATEDDYKYFCVTLADVMTVKSVNCVRPNYNAVLRLNNACGSNWEEFYYCNTPATNEQIQSAKSRVDSACKKMKLGRENTKQIEMPNGIIYWKATENTFGDSVVNFLGYDYVRVYAPSNPNIPAYRNTNGFSEFYMPFCMDIDGVPDNATETDCVNECPFGYGIRADGKILNGARADEWLEKSIQSKD